MAETVYTLDGKPHTMLRDDALAELVEETLGPDVARKVREMQLDEDSRMNLEAELAMAENDVEETDDLLYRIEREARAIVNAIEEDDITMERIKERCEEIARMADY